MKVNIDELLNQINIIDVISNFSPLTKAGSSYKTLCNIHGDKTPSLSINPRKQIYKCFVCDHGGNAIDYLIWAQKFSFEEAILYLAKSIGQEIDFISYKKNKYNEKQMKLINCFQEANNLFKYYLDIYENTNLELKEFLNERNITKDIINKFQLGFSSSLEYDNYLLTLFKKQIDESVLINTSLMNEENKKPFFINRLIFPIFDEDNNVIALAGRDISNKHSIKYLHSKESIIFKKNDVIYNYQNAKQYDQLIIVEGFMDVIAFSKIDQNNAIALMGVALSSSHISKLKKHKEILVFLDNDQAGKKSTILIIDKLIKNKINGYVLVNNTNFKDPDEIVNNENGKELLKSILNNKIQLINFIYLNLIKDIDKQNSEQINFVIDQLSTYIKYLDKIQLNILLNNISNDLNIDIDILKNIMFKPNVLKYNEYKLNSKTNESVRKKTLNIDKMLLALYTNPNLLNVQYIHKINWNVHGVLKLKIYSSILNHHSKGEQLSEEIKDILDKFIKDIPNHLVPNNEDELIELINRINLIDNFKYLESNTKLKINSNISDDEKINTLESKINVISKKNKR